MSGNIRKIKETYVIRGQEISVTSEAEIDKKTGKQIFNEALDDKAINKAFDIYREKNNVFGPQRIKKLRNFYNLNQRDFAAILGWSPTTLATYETGSLPNKSNNLILTQLENNHGKIIDYYKETRNRLSIKGRQSMDDFVSGKNNDYMHEKITNDYADLAFNTGLNIYTGFTEFNLMKVVDFVIYLIKNSSEVTKTKLNKLLFYSDFKFYNEEANSITGLRYAKLYYGPVPDKYELLYSVIVEMKAMHVEYNKNSDKNVYVADKEFDSSLFSENELKLMKQIVKSIGDKNASELTNMSHQEKGWRETDMSKPIAYDYSATLSL